MDLNREKAVIDFIDLQQFNSIKNRCDRFIRHIADQKYAWESEVESEEEEFDCDKEDEILKKPFILDISSIFSVFDHIEMHEDFSLCAQISNLPSGYGLVFASRKDNTKNGLSENSYFRPDNVTVKHLSLPQFYVNPLDIVEGDDTEAAELETIIFSLSLNLLKNDPLGGCSTILSSNPFEGCGRKWNVYTELASWTPVIYNKRNFRFCTQTPIFPFVTIAGSYECVKLHSYTFSKRGIFFDRIPRDSRYPYYYSGKKTSKINYMFSYTDLVIGDEIIDLSNAPHLCF